MTIHARLYSVLLGALVVSLWLAAPASADSGTADPVHHLVGLINEERAAAGLPGLRVDGALNDEGAAHSARMAESGTIFHNDDLFTPATKDRLGAKTIGENVASNSSLDDAHRRLMASDGHRANILSGAFDRVGIGAVQVGSTWYLTEVFVQSRTAAAAKPAPAPAPTTTAAPAPAPTTTAAPGTTAPPAPATTAPKPKPAAAPKPAPAPTTTAPAPAPAPAAAPETAVGGAVEVTLTVVSDPADAAVPLQTTALGTVTPAATTRTLTADQMSVLALTGLAALLVFVTAGAATRRALRFR